MPCESDVEVSRWMLAKCRSCRMIILLKCTCLGTRGLVGNKGSRRWTEETAVVYEPCDSVRYGTVRMARASAGNSLYRLLRQPANQRPADGQPKIEPDALT